MLPLIDSIRTETKEVKDPNKAKEALKSKQIRSQIRRQGQIPSAIVLEAFPYFMCFRI